MGTAKERQMPVDIEKIREFFSADIYATEVTGVRIVSAGGGNAVCEMETNCHTHPNAGNRVQGGAIFTLCDLCFAAAANAEHITEHVKAPTVTVSANISYLRPAPLGEKLVAEAKRLKHGKSTCCYEVKVYSQADPGRLIAFAAVDGFTSGN